MNSRHRTFQTRQRVKTEDLSSVGSSESADLRLKIYLLFHVIYQSSFAAETLPPAMGKEKIVTHVFSLPQCFTLLLLSIGRADGSNTKHSSQSSAYTSYWTPENKYWKLPSVSSPSNESALSGEIIWRQPTANRNVSIVSSGREWNKTLLPIIQ